MAYFINILTDNNRTKLYVYMGNLAELTPQNLLHKRVIHQEIYESEGSAHRRLEQLYSYTRMQTERIIRKNNPDWLDLTRRFYQPGVKLRPNVPNFTSLR